MPSAVKKLLNLAKKKKSPECYHSNDPRKLGFTLAPASHPPPPHSFSDRHIQGQYPQSTLQAPFMNQPYLICPCSLSNQQHNLAQTLQDPMLPLNGNTSQQQQFIHSHIQFQPQQAYQTHSQPQLPLLFTSSPQQHNSQTDQMSGANLTNPWKCCPYENLKQQQQVVQVQQQPQQHQFFQPDQYFPTNQQIQVEANCQHQTSQMPIMNQQVPMMHQFQPPNQHQQQQMTQQQLPQQQQQQQPFHTNQILSFMQPQNQLGPNHSIPQVASSAIMTMSTPFPQQSQPLSHQTIQPLQHFACQTIQHHQRVQSLHHHQNQQQTYQSHSQPHLPIPPNHNAQNLHHPRQQQQQHQPSQKLQHIDMEPQDCSRYANMQSIRDDIPLQNTLDFCSFERGRSKTTEPVYCNQKANTELSLPSYRPPPSYDEFIIQKKNLNGPIWTCHGGSLNRSRAKVSNYANLDGGFRLNLKLPSHDNLGQETGLTS